MDHQETSESVAATRPPAGTRESIAATRGAAVEELILRNELTIVFQPIVDLATARIAGYEALSRPDRSKVFAHAGALFEAAERVELYEEVEGIARREAMRIAGREPGDALLFLNNSPAVFTGPRFVERIVSELAASGAIPPHRVVLEITERTAHDLIANLATRSRDLQDRGFGVALDDVGAGISGLNQIMALRPNWMKLDLELISGIDLDPLKQNLIRFFVHFARLSNMNLVAEGIERDEELRTLIELGVSHGQGFLLGRPGTLGADMTAEMKARILDLHAQVEARRIREPGSVRVSSLAAPVATCQLDETIGAVAERLAKLLHQGGFVVLDGQRCVGWLDRDRIIGACGTDRRSDSVATLRIAHCPVVGADVTLGEALEIVAALPDEECMMPLVVMTRGDVVGLATHRQLLLAAADGERRAPSHIAPLTGLPSRVHADRWIAQRIKSGDPCDIAFVDLRDFDAYNVAYGFEQGDQMLVRLVGLMKTTVSGPDGASFVAHLGEDRFLLAFPRDARAKLVVLGDAFEDLHAEFFSARDLEDASYECDRATGRPERYPLTRLRIVYLPEALRRVADPRALHQLAGRLRLRSRRDETGDDPLLIVDERTDETGRRQSA